MLSIVLGQILKSSKSSPSKNYKSWQRFFKETDFKEIKFPVKIRDIHKLEKKNVLGISIFGYENIGRHPVYVSKESCEEKHWFFIDKKRIKKLMFLSKISIHLCMIIHYIVEENIFLVNIYMLPLQKKSSSVIKRLLYN